MSTAAMAPPPIPPAPREQRPATYSPEDLLILPDGERFELVNGQLVEKAMSGLSSWVGLEVGARLRNFVVEHKLGWTFGSDAGFQCFPNAPEKVRKPDASYVSRAKLPNGPRDGHIRVTPDLAVEVVSPTDSFGELDAKVEEYLAAGVLSVWVINPRTRIIQAFGRGNQVTRLHENDELTEPDILPGFHCRVSDLLPPVSMMDTDTAQSAAEADRTAAPAE